jgi:O-antigen/teichoic acid export membrane protein
MESHGSLAPGSAATDGVAEIAAAHGRHAAVGTVQVFTAQALALVAGLVTTAFLSRTLGPELYGLFAVASGIVVWIELIVTMGFRATTVKFVAEATDWRAVASRLVQAQLLVSLGAGSLLLIVAPALASWLKSPELASYLRLFALEIPIFALAHVLRSILVGRGAFGQGASVVAVRWLTRMVLIFLLVGLGFSVTGAILATIGASATQAIISLIFARPGLSRRSAFPMGHLAGYALPLLFHGMAMHMFSRIDLLAVKALGESPEAAGFYGAAQNLTIVPVGLLAGSFSPLLLSTLTQVLRNGRNETSRAMIRQATRLVLGLLPFAGLAAGAATEIVDLVYGSQFLPAGPLVAMLMFAALGLMMIRINSATFTAESRPGWPIAVSGPLLLLAVGAYLVLIPRFGAAGAAAAVTVLSWLGAAATMLAVHRRSDVAPPLATIVRTGVTTLVAYGLASIWHTSGASVILELLGITAIIITCLFLLGELTRRDLRFVRSLLRRERRAFS